MHFFGEVRAGVVDHHPQRGGHRSEQAGRAQCLAQERLGEAQVDEARTGDLRRIGDIVKISPSDDAFSKFARLAAGALGRAHDAVGLIVAKFGACRWLQHCRRAVAQHLGERGFQSGIQQCANIHHVSPALGAERVATGVESFRSVDCLVRSRVSLERKSRWFEGLVGSVVAFRNGGDVLCLRTLVPHRDDVAHLLAVV